MTNIASFTFHVTQIQSYKRGKLLKSVPQLLQSSYIWFVELWSLQIVWLVFRMDSLFHSISPRTIILSDNEYHNTIFPYKKDRILFPLMDSQDSLIISLKSLGKKREELKNRLRELRKNKKLTQVALQMQTGIEQALLSKFENGERVPPTETLVVLAEFYNVSIDYILCRTDNPKINK